jgi:hypothetical protein
MTTFYIYEVPGHKNGATNDLEKRFRENFEKYQIEPIVIETMEGPNTPEFWQVVGDREWYYADLNGYPRGVHYRLALESRQPWNDQTRYVLTPEDGRKGGSISGLLKPSKETKLKMGLAKAKLRNDANTIRERFKQWESSKYKFELIIAEEYNVSRSTINRILRKHIY